MEVVFNCSLKDYMLGEDSRVIETVIPNLVAYHSLLKIKDIFDTKATEKRKAIEKAEREGKKVTFADDEEEKKLTTEEEIYKKRIEEKLSIS